MHQKKIPVTVLDVLVLAAIGCFFAYIAYRLLYLLDYKWDWAIIPTYLIHFDQEQQRWTANILLEGLFTTIKLSIWATLFAAFIGVIIGLMRISPRLLFKLIGISYIELIRNIPALVLVFIFYYFISDQILGFLGIEDFFRRSTDEVQGILTLLFFRPELITQFLSGVLTLALFQGAYIAEIVRAGIQAIDTGQWEAAQSLGLPKRRLLRLVIMPQAIRIMLPPLANEFINTIKWSSIVSIISIQELTFQGLQVMASTQASIEVWLTISLMYLVLCLMLSFLSTRIEAYLARSQTSPPSRRYVYSVSDK